MAVLTVSAVSVVMAVSVLTVIPLKLNPLFRDPDKKGAWSYELYEYFKSNVTII